MDADLERLWQWATSRKRSRAALLRWIAKRALERARPKVVWGPHA